MKPLFNILLMSLIPPLSLQHKEENLLLMDTETEDNFLEIPPNIGELSDLEDQLMIPLSKLYQLDAEELLRQLNGSFFNFSFPNVTQDVQGCNSGQNTIVNLITIILYSLVCIVGLFGNTLVIYVVLRFSKMQTVTNIYILNLAIADECFLIGIPFLLYTMQSGSWKFGEYGCKAFMVSTSITQFTSSIFLLIMSADRYIAVCHPISSPRYRTPMVSQMVSGFAWLTSVLLMLPVILFANAVQNGEHATCNIEWPEAQNNQSGTTFILYTLALGFATPLTFILVFYWLVIQKLHTVGPKHKSKEKKRSHRKVTKLVLTVITVYILCWLPYWICQVALITSTPDKCASNLEITIFLLVGCLGYSNSAMNPILYAFLSDNFKKSFMKACTCAARKDVNAQLQMENSLFPKFNKSKNNERLLTSSKNKQKNCLQNNKSKTMMTSSGATTTTTCTTNTTTAEANNAAIYSSLQKNNVLIIPPNNSNHPSSSTNNSSLVMLPNNDVNENSNMESSSDGSDIQCKPPVLHTDL